MARLNTKEENIMKLQDNNEYRTYNLLFPLWLLIWLPSWLWLLLIPLNYLIDTAVTWYTLRDLEDCRKFCMKNSWKICINGFICDFCGSLILLLILLGASFLETLPRISENQLFEDIVGGIMMNPFTNIGSAIICLIAIVFTAILIYFVDRKLLCKLGLGIERATHTAKWLAIITAPYLFLFPSDLLYY